MTDLGYFIYERKWKHFMESTPNFWNVLLWITAGFGGRRDPIHFVQLWVDTKGKSSMHWQQTSPRWWHHPVRTWARPYKPHWASWKDLGHLLGQMSWAKSNPNTAALQQHTARNAVETIPNLKAVENVKEKEEWGPNQDAAPTFLPVHPHKLFINIPKYTYQWRIHGDSLNTKLLSIMTRRTCLTPSSSPTPCPGWITHKAPLVFYSSKVLSWTPSSPMPLMSAAHL